MTVTRGLGGALILSLVAGAALNRNWRRAPLLIGYAVLLVAVLFIAVRSETALLIASGDIGQGAGTEPAASRPGDAQRMKDIGFVFGHSGLSTALVGHGLGAPIGARNRIELTYLEIFYKQGLLGLALWVFLLAYSFVLYLRVPSETRQFGLAFLLSTFFVAVATASNTFMTGSIGMAVIFVAVASLLALSRERRHPMLPEDWYGLRRPNAPDASPKGDAETPRAPLERLSG
jgi:O-antigen ligase